MNKWLWNDHTLLTYIVWSSEFTLLQTIHVCRQGIIACNNNNMHNPSPTFYLMAMHVVVACNYPLSAYIYCLYMTKVTFRIPGLVKTRRSGSPRSFTIARFENERLCPGRTQEQYTLATKKVSRENTRVQSQEYKHAYCSGQSYTCAFQCSHMHVIYAESSALQCILVMKVFSVWWTDNRSQRLVNDVLLWLW